MMQSVSSYHAYAWAAFTVVAITLARLFTRTRGTKLPGAPVVGAQYPWEPLLFTKYRFPAGGWPIVYEGYKKFKNDVFTIVRPESTITVLPKRYVNELSNIPDTKLNPIVAIVDDLMSTYTGIDILIGSHLSPHSIQTKLNPRLGSFLGTFEEELEIGMKKDFPHAGDTWVKVDLNDVILKIVSRLTARLFVGFPLCRNDEWLSINTLIVEDIFRTVVIMRLFPPILHPLVGKCLPSLRRLRRCMRRIHALLIPVLLERKRLEVEQGDSYERPDDVIQWMMDLADENEAKLDNLATRYVYTIIGSMHTVTSAIKDTLYDICARPEYVKPLREELEQVLKEDHGWKKSTAAKMQKTDSFMKEVQRLNPPSALGFKRVVKEPITLSDGLQLPKGAYICVVTTSHLQDDIAPPGPNNFDGFRYHKKAIETGFGRYQYSSTDGDHIHFGHGRYACPGRFAASVEIKIILARILLHYDMKFPEGQGRPKNMTVLELSFQDPAGRIMFKQRSG